MNEHRLQRRIDAVYRFLQKQSTFVLSTVGEDGAVHSAPLYYLPTPALELYWLSSRSSRHSMDIQQNTQASAAVFQPTFEWKQIAGVQMRGSCSLASEQERALHLNAYCERFHLGSILSAAISQATMYRFIPHWIRYTDNSRHFGYKFEIELSA
jgi:uncharacterized protein YhbP (UPF0306 family)